MRRAAALVALVGAIAGCGSQGEQRKPAPARRQPSDAHLIRGWSRALNAGDYRRAAAYFARGAVVEQTQEVRLRSRAAAIVFNSGLPCRADVTGVEDEGATSLASFRLKRGPGGPCNGSARVRFTIKRGKFTEWRQLPEAPTPPGTSA
jgi:hypothetical protein